MEAPECVCAGGDIRGVYVKRPSGTPRYGPAHRVADRHDTTRTGTDSLFLSVDDFEASLFALQIAYDIVTFEQPPGHSLEHPVHE